MTMDKYIAGFPDQLIHALALTDIFSLTDSRKFDHVVVSGMGGSAIGAALVKDLIHGAGAFTFTINRTYHYPTFLGKETLAIFSSYSGNTEETLSAFSLAKNLDCKVICITSGGLLQQAAVEDNIPCIQIPGNMPPRTCVGYSMIAILSILHAAGCISDRYMVEIKVIANALKHNSVIIKNYAAQIAEKLKNKIPLIYTSEAFESIGLRWKQQMNENAKQHCFNNIIPEMNHNELASYSVHNNGIVPVLLEMRNEDDRIISRFKLTEQLLNEHETEVLRVTAIGETFAEQLFYLLHLGDWVSYYAALNNKVDPIDISILNSLKAELSKATK